jgi:alkylhydroperoxidase/carboxymuconolactone decarboxylase family protein YurZ
METIQNNQLSNQEKTLISMGAAMGAGCRTCADKLYDVAISLNIPKAEMLKAFLLGLDAKTAAVKTMQEKVSALMDDGNASNTKEFPPKLASMIRMASFTAANSAPDCLTEIKQAMSKGITTEQVQLCIATGKMVRKNATTFSDQEISDNFRCSESDIKGVCCPVSVNTQKSSACSCG